MLAQQVFLVTLGLMGLIGCVWTYGHGDYGHGHHDAYATGVDINSHRWGAVDHYGHQIGKPLLTKNYGKLTPLVSALAPERSFVGVIHPGFYKNHHGKINYREKSSIGAIVI